MDEKIIYDLFPAHLVVAAAGFTDDVATLSSEPATPGAYYVGTTRIIVTDKLVLVAADSNEGPTIIFRESYTEFYKSHKPAEESWLVTTSGKMLAFRKDVNCGCSSRLRSWQPYKTLYSLREGNQ